MTESIIQPESFPKDFCMFAIIIVYIDWNRLVSVMLVSVSSS